MLGVIAAEVCGRLSGVLRGTPTTTPTVVVPALLNIREHLGVRRQNTPGLPAQFLNLNHYRSESEGWLLGPHHIGHKLTFCNPRLRNYQPLRGLATRSLQIQPASAVRPSWVEAFGTNLYGCDDLKCRGSHVND